MSFDPRLTPARPDLAARSLEGKVTAERYAEGRPFTVSAPVLDLTIEADRNAGLATQLLAGETFTVYEEDDQTGLAWGQSVTDGYVGYVSLAGLDEGEIDADCQIIALATHIYPEPSIKTRPLEGLPMGARFRSAGTAEGFVELASGGFVPIQHIGALTPFSDDPADVARCYLGTPYLWGGRSAWGLDCSALVQLAFAAAGKAIPRDTDMQAELGVPVNGDLTRGDLVFWDGHVGIMEDAEFLLHANGHHMAVVSEPLGPAAERIAAEGYGPITGRRRLING